MMDADFEYGLQATKWQSYVDVRKFPSFFEIPGTDYPVSNVVSDGAGPASNITVRYTGTNQSANLNSFISVFGLSNQQGTFADRAEGYFIVTANTATSANYIAKGVVPAGNVQSNFTFSRRANVYNGGTLTIPFSNIYADGGSNLQVYTSNAHGLLPAFPLLVNTFAKVTNETYSNFFGTFFVSNVTSSNSFNIVANNATFGNVGNTTSNMNAFNTTLYIAQYASQQHRPYDGGVLLSTLSPAHGSTVCRQSKKAFRYQSGKGILFSSGTLFAPNLDIQTVTPSGPTTTVSGVPFFTSPIVMQVSSTSNLAVGQTIAGPIISGTSGLGPISNTMGILTISAVGTNTITATFPGTYPQTLVPSNSLSISANATTKTTGTVLLSGAVNLPVASTTGFAVGSNISGLPASLGNATITNIGTGQSNLQFVFTGSWPVGDVPFGTAITGVAPTGGSTTTNGPPVETPSNNFSLVVASTLGFLPGQTINTYDAAGTVLKPFGAMNPVTINAIYTSNSTLSCNFVGTYSNVTTGNTVTFRSSGLTLTSNIIPGGTTFTLPVAGTTGFAAGQTVTSLLGLNMGTISITGVTPAGGSAGANLAMNFTGTWPTPNPIPLGTSVATLPAGSNLQIVTDVAHGIPTSGATATIRNFTTTAINGTGYTIAAALDSRTVNVVSQQALTSGIVNLGDQPRLVITNWHGSTVRAGCFEDPNGLFWEYDGQTLAVVRRQSTFTCAGYVTTSPQSQILIGTTPTTNSFVSSTTTVTGFTTAVGETSNTFTMTGTSPLHNITAGQYCQLPVLGYAWVVGPTDFYQVTLGFLPTTSAVTITQAQIKAAAFYTPTTRFQDQLKVNDRFTLRGMVHQVTSIQGQGILTFNPPYRGAAAITSAAPVKACKIKELRVPQAQFNRDTVDGKGPSGYKVDLSRQQMIGLQYTWYGAGFVDFMIRGPDGNWIMCHRIKNNNVNDEAYMRSGNLPVRYELSVESRAAVSSLASDMTASQTTVTINDPTTYFPVSGGTLLIDNELIYYTGTTATSFTGCTRAASLVYNVNDTNRTFTGQAASTHLANTSVNLISCTATPTMTHWGSSFLTDGGFDEERGYYFNYSNTAVNVGTSLTAAFPAFAIRLAPSVTNGLVGDIGNKELLNRAQLLLQKLEVTATQSIQTVGLLNPTNVTFDPTAWVNVNNQSNGTQPSFAQFYPGNLLAGFNPLPGERIFQTIVQAANQNNLDLTGIKELTNSCIGGNRPFPDGPDVLLIYCQSLGSACTAQVNLFWSEAQA
jgi:hypothetical protein